MNTKDKIINASESLFKAYGYKKVSMDEIAKQAKVTKKTVYSYFKTKADLFEYFINREIKNMKDIALSVEKDNTTFIDRIHEMVYRLIKYKKESDFISIVTNEVKEDMKEFDEKITVSIRKFIEDKLNESIKKNEIKKLDVKLVSFLIYTMYKGIILSYPSDELNEEEISNTLSTILKDGLLVKGEE